MPSRKRTLREISILFTIPIEITAMMETAGITILLKMALPAVVPIPPEKPDASFSTKRKKKEVNKWHVACYGVYCGPPDTFRKIAANIFRGDHKAIACAPDHETT